ncbi:ammonium transporter, partial [Ostertagia ostertagi]
MIFVGFGFLMAFLKRYGFSAVSVNLLLGLCFYEDSSQSNFKKRARLRLECQMICSRQSCAVVLITMGVLLGRMTPVQFLLLAFFETSLAVLVDHVIVNILHAVRLSCMPLGPYFGLAAALVGKKKNVMEMDEQGSIHHSDLFSMIGTLLLWVFFPSFNAAVQEPEDARHRAIMNTYLAMASGTVTTFILSSFVDNLGRFNMIHIQSSTLSGGVAIGK